MSTSIHEQSYQVTTRCVGTDWYEGTVWQGITPIAHVSASRREVAFALGLRKLAAIVTDRAEAEEAHNRVIEERETVNNYRRI